MMLYRCLSNITHHLPNSRREVGGVVEILAIVELTHRMTCAEMKFTDQEKKWDQHSNSTHMQRQNQFW